jgi:phospho-N-acetylmuramoyl-pentapeptide-transferase
MGGIVVLVLWAGAVCLLGGLFGWPEHSGLVLSAGLGFGLLGFADDVLSLRRRHSTGLTGPQKLTLGSALSIGLFFAFRAELTIPQFVPFTDLHVSLPWVGALFLAWILLVSVTNTANLTDGLDGLGGGVYCLVLAGLLWMEPSTGNAALILPLMAALAGFLWMNAHPAALFLGDVGSFGVGGVIGALALAEGDAFLLPLLAGVFVLEAVSVILQVGLRRLIGRRPFKMAPLHHHFEDSGGGDHWLPSATWPESKVTARFLLLQGAFVLLAVWAHGG